MAVSTAPLSAPNWSGQRGGMGRLNVARRSQPDAAGVQRDGRRQLLPSGRVGPPRYCGRRIGFVAFRLYGCGAWHALDVDDT
jgi:hypothetical protein